KCWRGEAHEPQQLRYARFDLPTRPALQRRHQPHVFCHREVREQPRLLNHIPDAAPQLDAVPIGGRFLVYENFSLRWNEKPVGEFQEGSLSASTASQQNQGLSGGDLQRDIRNNFPHLAAARTETYILKLDRAADGLWRCQMRLPVLREPLVYCPLRHLINLVRVSEGPRTRVSGFRRCRSQSSVFGESRKREGNPYAASRRVAEAASTFGIFTSHARPSVRSVQMPYQFMSSSYQANPWRADCGCA